MSGRRYAPLVESYRNEAGQPRQRTICTLGRLQAGGDVDRLVAGLQRVRGLPVTVGSSALDGLRFLDSRQAGEVWALGQLWKQLRLDDLALVWRRSQTEVDVLGCLRAMVWNRLSRCTEQARRAALAADRGVARGVRVGRASAAPAPTACHGRARCAQPGAGRTPVEAAATVGR